MIKLDTEGIGCQREAHGLARDCPVSISKIGTLPLASSTCASVLYSMC